MVQRSILKSEKMKKYTVILSEKDSCDPAAVYLVQANNVENAFEVAAKEMYDNFYCAWASEEMEDAEPFTTEGFICVAVFEGNLENLYSEVL